MAVTDNISDRLVRLPLWIGLGDKFDSVLGAATEALKVAVDRGNQELVA